MSNGYRTKLDSHRPTHGHPEPDRQITALAVQSVSDENKWKLFKTIGILDVRNILHTDQILAQKTEMIMKQPIELYVKLNCSVKYNFIDFMTFHHKKAVRGCQLLLSTIIITIRFLDCR